MAKYTYKEIVSKAKGIKKSVEKDYKLGVSSKWCYYICKAIISPNKDIAKISVEEAKNPTGTHISRQIDKAGYIDIAKRIIKYVEAKKQLPNYVTYKDFKLNPRLCAYVFARVLVYYDEHQAYAKYVNVNSKCFTKESESDNEVYKYFKQVFGDFGDTIDGALAKVSGHGYGYYYDDSYSNRTSIDRMKNYQGINCTDSMQVFYNIVLALIQKGKYKKVECLHVRCSGGDGHVRMRITMNDGSYIYRDPACTLNSGGTCNWCTSGYTLLGINPSWFMENLNR